jgi:hypothetical protein
MTPQEQTIKLHEEWLRHPVTQDVLKVLSARKQHYIKTIQDGILLESNESWEDKLRASITTCDVMLTIGFNTAQFIEQLNKVKK